MRLVPRSKIARWAAGVLAALLLSVLATGTTLLGLAWNAMGAAPEGARLARMRKSPQHNGERFQNPLPEYMADPWTMLRRWFGEKTPYTQPRTPPPVQPRVAKDFPAPAGTLAVTWLGHSSLLIELDGTTLLTDPVFSQRTSPLQFLGPARFHPTPLGIDALPPIDAVVLSHDHYDHLDHGSILALRGRVRRFVVPLGLGAHLESWGVPAEHITELDWWDQTALKDLRLICTPARHFSGRGFTDRNRTLWASWSLLGPQHRFYFSGDTAMSPDFAEIGRRFGPFDVAAIEVGAYDRDWPDVHLGPEQAVDAHRALGAKKLLPVHWGTFDLALHGWTEPVERLWVAARAVDVDLLAPQVGQRIDVSAPEPAVPWWPSIPWQTAEQHPVVSTGLSDPPSR